MKKLFILLGLIFNSCGTNSGTLVSKDISCSVVTHSSGTQITCPDGTGSFISNGSNGSDGHNALASSLASPNNNSSHHCSLIVAGTDYNDNAHLDLNEITMTQEICDGTNGVPAASVTYINFCSNVQNFSEVGIKIGNTIIASFSANDAGDLTHLAVLKAGSYRTTDGYSCNFSVTSNGDVVH